MHPHLIIGVAALLVSTLLVFEGRKHTLGKLVTKSAASILFVVTAVLQPHRSPEYFHALLVGLVLCLVGDVCLAIPGKKAFLVGLVAFLLGHVAYVVAFTAAAPIGASSLVGLLLTASVSGAVFAWLKPKLGKMKGPVAAYVVVITLMVAAASSAVGSELGATAQALILAGAVAFYLSDLFVARDRFVSTVFVNRLVGLPLYYGAQYVLAFSVAYVGS